eukprot:TRINITY_DN447_c0_g1_i1.p1 TRINITY_DN447_c0_g1~~TRINITY_DN447_c0_g1_i1.p1  ORF type:complete len:170 (-),score=16.26 TRINITY_DN447_c0_g1_i1:348-857(-)
MFLASATSVFFLSLIIFMASSLLVFPAAEGLSVAYVPYSSLKSTKVCVAGGLRSRSLSSRVRVRAMADNKVESAVIEKMGIRIERNPSQDKLSELKVRSWPKWGCPPSRFPWTYTAKETCYLLEGKVKVYPEGYNDFVEIGPKDLVEFPKGMKCTWDVSEAVDKHYTFD